MGNINEQVQFLEEKICQNKPAKLKIEELATIIDIYEE